MHLINMSRLQKTKGATNLLEWRVVLGNIARLHPVADARDARHGHIPLDGQFYRNRAFASVLQKAAINIGLFRTYNAKRTLINSRYSCAILGCSPSWRSISS
jgi:hypothetical protein